jgi:UDP-N-acetylmuramoyl-tripeptide--D-alanyl-D-alanine ligase
LMGDCKARVVTFGVEDGDYRASKIRLDRQIHFEMSTPVGAQEIALSAVGSHNISNALAAAAACVSVGMSLAAVAEGLRDFVPPLWRMEMVNLSGNRRLIRDCYNANPQSVSAALQVLSQGGPELKKLAILADMMELGEYAESLHEEVGRIAARLGIDRVVFVGTYGSFFSKGFLSEGGDGGALTLAVDKDAAWGVIGPDLHKFEAILVKGSRAMKMEYLANLISQEN